MYKNLEFVFDCFGLCLAILICCYLNRYLDVVINILWNLFNSFIVSFEMIIFQSIYFVFN